MSEAGLAATAAALGASRSVGDEARAAVTVREVALLCCRWRWWVVVVLFIFGLGLDLARLAADQWSAWALLGVIHLYQHTLSPRMLLLGARCRFTPTCSYYAEGAIAKDGALVGSARAVWRILRCAFWTSQGTVDPP